MSYYFQLPLLRLRSALSHTKIPILYVRKIFHLITKYFLKSFYSC
jgi:hypothetical protein